MPRKLVPADVVAQIPKLYQEGKTMPEIARELRISFGTVQKTIRVHPDVQARPPGGGPARKRPAASAAPLSWGFRAAVLTAMRRAHPETRTMPQLRQETSTTTFRVYSTLRMAARHNLAVCVLNTGRGRNPHHWALTDAGVEFVDALPDAPPDAIPVVPTRTTSALTRPTHARALRTLRRAHPKPCAVQQLCGSTQASLKRAHYTMRIAEQAGLAVRRRNTTGVGSHQWVWTLTERGIAFVDALPGG